MDRIRLLGMMIFFPIISVMASAVVRFPLDWVGFGEVVMEIIGIITFFSMLTLLYGLVWYRDYHAAED